MKSSRGPGGDRGASILELAIIAPVMVLIVMGVLDLARGYQMQIRLENAAREGAAFAQLYPNSVACAGDDDITDRITAEDDGLAGLDGFTISIRAEDAGGNLTVPVTGCASSVADSGERLLVEVEAVFDVMTPMVEKIVGGTIQIAGSSQIEVQG